MQKPLSPMPSPLQALGMALFCASLLIFGFLVDTAITSNVILTQELDPLETTEPTPGVLLPDHPQLQEALKSFSPSEIIRAKQYRNERIRAFLNRQVLTLSFLVFLIGSLWLRFLWLPSQFLSRWIRHPRLQWGVQRSLFCFFFLVSLWVILLPETYYGGYFLETAYEMSNESLGDWILRIGKFRVLFALFLIAFTLLAETLFHRFKKYWFGPAAIGTWVGLLFFLALKPLLVDPLFHTFTPLPENDLRQSIEQLAADADVPTDKIFVMNASVRTRRSNAVFTGLGHSRRIVLYDNLLAQHPKEEVLTVLAHEIGHWKNSHIWQGWLLSLPLLLLIFWLTSRGMNYFLANETVRGWQLNDALFLPLLLGSLLLHSYWVRPLANSVSRSFERQADQMSIQLTQDPQTFKNKMVRIARQNLSDPIPHPLYYFYFASHPSTLERIESANLWKQTGG